MPAARRIGLVGITAAAGLSITLGAQATVTEFRGGGFSVRGSIAPDRLAAVACDLEKTVRALGPPPAGTSTPVVVAVDGARSIRDWLPHTEGGKATNPLGAYWPGLFGHHIVVRVDTGPEERFRRVLHEYAHFMTHLAHPDPPRWLDEGLSELWEHATIAPGHIEIGQPVEIHLKRLRSGKTWIPVRDLAAAHDIPPANTEAFYAGSWALAHYLMAGRPGGPLVPNASNLPSDEELKAYVRGPMAIRVVLPTTDVGGASCSDLGTIRPVPHLEALIHRARALADGERPDAALPLLKDVQSLDSTNVEALETVGFVHFRGNRPLEAAATFDRVIAGGKASHLSFYYRAVLAGPVPGRTDGPGLIPQVEYLRRAVALSSGFAPAVERLKQLSGKN